jgi:hypothetical protein
MTNNAIILGFLRHMADCWEEEKRKLAETRESLAEIEEKLEPEFTSK